MLHAVSLGLALAVLWWFLSGYTLTLIVGLGIGSILAVLWIARRMDIIDHETHPIHLGTGMLTYVPWLLKEIVLANWDVAKAVLKGGDAVRPRVMTIKASQPTDVGKVTYANSITLTPGTVTIAVDDDTFLVHSLTPGSYDGVMSGEMDRRVTALEIGDRSAEAEDKS